MTTLLPKLLLMTTINTFGLVIGIQMIFWGMFAPIFGLLADKFGGNKAVFLVFLIFALSIYMLYSVLMLFILPNRED